jgi:hypothetical protein
VTIMTNHHCGMFWAGIQSNFLDTGFRRHDETMVHTYLCRALLSVAPITQLPSNGNEEVP